MVRHLVWCGLLLAACGDDGAVTGTDAGAAGDAAVPDAGVDAGPFEPDSYCPGGDGCPDEGDGILYAGAAAVTITPAFDESTEVLTVDVDGDGKLEPADGDEFHDADGDGKFDGVWIAGFGRGRAASAAHDDIWVRSLALRRDQTTLVLSVIDSVGFFKDDIDIVRGMVADLDVDYVMMAATHGHQSRDTVGIWGPSVNETGLDPEWMTYVRERAAQSIREAVDDLRAAHVQYASFFLRDAPGGVSRYHGDNRDPIIVDDEVRVIRFMEADGGATIGTLVNWASHPEYLGADNTLLSSDYPHFLRQAVEDGAAAPDGTMAEGLGGVALFFQGALGGQIGPNHISLAAWDGTPVPRRTLEGIRTVGEQVGWLVLDALGPDGGSVTDETASLGFRNRSFFVRVQNLGYHVAILSELFDRQAYHWDPDLTIRPGDNEPDILSEVAVLDIGRAQLITAPGELHPELFVGGYDGSFTPDGMEIVAPDNPNPPELSMAPGPPYLRDLARDDAEYVFLLGLGNDMLGYLIPSYNYQLDRIAPYVLEAPGDHYEETNSVGVDGWPTIEREVVQLLEWTPED